MGECDRGASCRFSHAEGANPSRGGGGGSTCIDFQKGRSDRGGGCRFSHVAADVPQHEPVNPDRLRAAGHAVEPRAPTRALPLPTKEFATLVNPDVTGGATFARFTRTGGYCLTGGADRTLRLWNPHKGLLIRRYAGHAKTRVRQDAALLGLPQWERPADLGAHGVPGLGGVRGGGGCPDRGRLGRRQRAQLRPAAGGECRQPGREQRGVVRGALGGQGVRAGRDALLQARAVRARGGGLLQTYGGHRNTDYVCRARFTWSDSRGRERRDPLL